MDTEDEGIPPPPPRLDQPRHGGNHMFMSPRNQRDRDVWAAQRWTVDNWTFQQIADALGLSHRSNARAYVERGLRGISEQTEEAAAAARAVHRVRLEAALEVAFDVMAKDHVHVSQGRVMKDDEGTPLVDDGPKLAAADRIRSLSESLRKLDGLDAATKAEVTTVNLPQSEELQARLRLARENVDAEERALRGDEA